MSNFIKINDRGGYIGNLGWVNADIVYNKPVEGMFQFSQDSWWGEWWVMRAILRGNLWLRISSTMKERFNPVQ